MLLSSPVYSSGGVSLGPSSLGEITLQAGTRGARGRTHRVRWKVAPVSDSLPYKVSDSLNIEQVDSRGIASHPPALTSMPSHPPA